MIEFSFLSVYTNIVFECALIVSMLLQAICLIFIAGKFKKIPTLLLHISVLALNMLYAYTFAKIILSSENGLSVITNFEALRYTLCAFILICCLLSYLKKRRTIYVLALAFSLSTLPFFEMLCGCGFIAMLAVSIASGVLFGILCILTYYKKSRNEISVLSIKQAIDSLEEGILFAEKNGFILLINRKMYELMDALAGKQERNSKEFYHMLKNGKVRAKKADAADQLIFELPDGTVWHFTLSEFSIKNKIYYQLYAADITEECSLTKSLATRLALLTEQKQKLLFLLDNLEEIKYQEELGRRRIQLHDSLGQRIALIQTAIRENDISHAKVIAEDIEKFDMETEDLEHPREILMRTVDVFAEIGVELVITGELPKNDELAYKVFLVIRECATNAVRHGFANRIEAKLSCSEDGFLVRVRNNGRCSGSVTMGGGLSSIKEYVGNGGYMNIAVEPLFCLTVLLKEEA